MCIVWFLQQTAITLYSLQWLVFLMLADCVLCEARPSINVTLILPVVKVKVKRSRYRPDVAQRVGRGIALLFHDRGTRRWWVVSSTLRPHFTPGKDPVPILQEAGWAPGPVSTGGKSRPHRDSIPERPARSSVAIPTEPPGPHSTCSAVIKVRGVCLVGIAVLLNRV